MPVKVHDHLDAELHAVDQGGLVHLELGVVLGPDGSAGLAAHAQEGQGSRGLFDEAGRVLSAVGLVKVIQGVGAYDLLGGLRRQGGELALPEFYDVVCSQSGYIQALEAKNDMESRGRIENVQELKSNILGFLEQDPEDATLSGFLNEIALYTDLDAMADSDDCVTMMTIHSAKGLEFPVVYVVGMEEGIFPGNSAQFDEDELEEERRLC